MTDSKYAALPGIAYDQPDYYESEDVCNKLSDVVNEEQTDCIERLPSNVEESFAKFQKHWLSSQSADFSGKIGLKLNNGYRSWSGPYELQAIGEPESLVQKLNRLKCEVVELQQDIQKMVESKVEGCDHEELAFQVEALQKQLLDLKVVGAGQTNAENLLKRKIGDDVQLVLNSANSLKPEQPVDTDSSKVIYHLQFKPNQVKLDQASKEANIVHRLDKLEQLFGISPDKMNQLCAETGQKNIADAVKALDNKVSLLDANHVDQMEARLGILSQKLNYVASKQASVEEFEKSETIKEIGQTVKQLEPLIHLLPSVVERLSSLKTLHDEAVGFSQTVGTIETLQVNLESAIRSQIQLLTDVQQGLVANVQTMNEAIKKFKK